MTAPSVTTCFRHPDRRAGVTCQRCGRPICASCMIQASVGFQCPDCVKGTKQKVYNAANIHTANRPWVTYALIGVNTAVFAVGAVLAQISSAPSLTRLGGLVVRVHYRGETSPEGVAVGEWYRMFTSGFLHANIIHLAMNMLVLYIIGNQLEQALGRWKYLGLYLASLMAGAFAVVAFSPGPIPTVGASGAIYGLFGVAFVYQRSLGVDPWKSGLGGLILINLVFTFAVPGISIAGHLGGLVGGAAVAFLVFALERRISSKALAFGACAAISAALFAGGIAVAQNPIL